MQPQSGSTVLVADDHPELANLFATKLDDQGWNTRVVHSGTAAISALAEALPDVVVTDLRMPGVDGLGVVDASRARDPELPVIVMTGFGDIATAVEAMRRGAWHFVTKPVRFAEMIGLIHRALAQRGPRASAEMIGSSAPMRELARQIARVASSSSSVLVRGETGSGKEVVARAIHAASERRDRAFVAINCTAMPEGLAESELFGHARGAFTGAMTARAGVFAQADRGTLFLDEIGDMPLPLQAKLLRVLQDGEIRAVGAESSRHVDVRVIAATHQDLEARVRAGQFREDLLYRLAVVPIAVPALRERVEDIAALATHFFALARARNPKAIARAVSPELLRALEQYRWPGNVRELANLMERLAVTGEHEELGIEDLQLVPPVVHEQRLATLREVEDEHVERVLAHCGGHKARAAAILGIDLSTLYRRDRSRRNLPQ